MRDRKTIEREMFNAREDLEQSLSELKHVVQGKADPEDLRAAIIRAAAEAGITAIAVLH